MSKVNARIGIFSDSKNVDTYVDVFNLENRISIPSCKWDDILADMKNNEKLEKFIQIYEYNINIMNELKSEFKKDAPVLKRNK